MEFRVRRISFDRSYRRGETEPNPFERIARRPYQGSPLRICFHTAGLASLSDEETLIVKELSAPYRQRAIEIVRTPGNRPPEWPEFLTFEIERWDNDMGGAVLRRGQARIGLDIQAPDRWSHEVRTRLNQPDQVRDLAELLVARELGDVDILVTADRELLALRSFGPVSLLSLLSPHEAFAVIGPWSRAIGQSYLAGPLNIADWYPVVLVSGLLKESAAAFFILNQSPATAQAGPELKELTGSISRRLERAIAALDRLVLNWQRRAQPGGDAELDAIVLATSAIQDNLALFAGRLLGVTGFKDWEWSLRSEKWRNVVAHKGPRGKHLNDYLVDQRAWLRIAEELRHHAVHRTLFDRARYLRFPDTEERIRLPERVATAIRTILDELAEPVSNWGLTRTNLAGDTKMDFDPLPFVARLIAGTARLINGVMRCLDPVGDSRYSDELRASALSEHTPASSLDEMFTPESVRIALLSSPLSGLVE